MRSGPPSPALTRARPSTCGVGPSRRAELRARPVRVCPPADRGSIRQREPRSSEPFHCGPCCRVPRKDRVAVVDCRQHQAHDEGNRASASQVLRLAHDRNRPPRSRGPALPLRPGCPPHHASSNEPTMGSRHPPVARYRAKPEREDDGNRASSGGCLVPRSLRTLRPGCQPPPTMVRNSRGVSTGSSSLSASKWRSPDTNTARSRSARASR